VTRDFWGDPFDGAPHPDRGDYRDATDPTDRAERVDFDPAFEADHARKLRAIREQETNE
jgi:hypothetical protein